MRPKHSEYMPWAKLHGDAKFNLASSGVAGFPLGELPVSIEQLEISGDSVYGYEPLQRAIANKCGVDPDCVVAAAGASMANHLAMATLLDPGDEVLIEHPTYELLAAAALYLGAQLKNFARREENGYGLDPAEIRRVLSPRTKLIILTNLHNPSSVLTEESVLQQVGDIAQSVGARVLVDEVYLNAAFARAPRFAFHLGETFITTNSLTKVYGLSGLRCGWILAAPDLARQMWRLNDLFGVNAAHLAERLSVIALDHLDQIAAAARSLLDINRALLRGFFDSRDDLSAVWPVAGTVLFPRVRSGSAEPFCESLRENYETSVVPGTFFEMPGHFRIGVGGETAMVAEGLKRLASALDAEKKTI
jgi:aspartate/methionine/tyrosine aminotransferase